jgi:predicted nucleotidyltransferase
MQRIMEKNWHLIEEMTEKLKALKPCEVILFGSYARGNPTEDSDIDVVVVLDSDDFVKTHKEKMDRRRPVRNAVMEIRYEIPMDILVYSNAEINYLRKEGSSFIKEIDKTGKVLYEKVSD